MPLYNYDSAMKGIYRAILLTNDTSNNARLYIPSICNNSIPCPLYSDGSLNTSVYNNNINSYFQARWVNPNLSQLSSASGPVACWVIFENGNINYPVIIAYFSNVVLTGALSFSSGAPGNTYSGGVLENANAMAIFNRLIWNGASIGGACALLGMIFGESSYDPTLTNSIGAIGICQWLFGRKDTLINGGPVGIKYWSKPTNYLDLNTQVDYLVYELKYRGTYKAPTWDEISKEYNNENDILDLLYRLVRYFEIPFGSEDPNYLSTEEKLAAAALSDSKLELEYENYKNRKTEAITCWNILKNGTIQNGKYVNTIGNVVVNEKGFAWPVEKGQTNWNTLTAGYGYYPGGAAHSGIDIGVLRNSNCVAIANGIVTLTGYYNASGRYVGSSDSSRCYWVHVYHEEYNITARYLHLNFEEGILVNEGDVVTTGQVICKSGNTGNTSGPHLHFDIQNGNTNSGGNHVNPFNYISRPSEDKINNDLGAGIGE